MTEDELREIFSGIAQTARNKLDCVSSVYVNDISSLINHIDAVKDTMFDIDTASPDFPKKLPSNADGDTFYKIPPVTCGIFMNGMFIPDTMVLSNAGIPTAEDGRHRIRYILAEQLPSADDMYYMGYLNEPYVAVVVIRETGIPYLSTTFNSTNIWVDLASFFNMLTQTDIYTNGGYLPEDVSQRVENTVYTKIHSEIIGLPYTSADREVYEWNGSKWVRLQGNPVLQEKTVTSNGEYTPDEGYDGLSKVTVNVPSTVSRSMTAKLEFSAGISIQMAARLNLKSMTAKLEFSAGISTQMAARLNLKSMTAKMIGE